MHKSEFVDRELESHKAHHILLIFIGYITYKYITGQDNVNN